MLMSWPGRQTIAVNEQKFLWRIPAHCLDQEADVAAEHLGLSQGTWVWQMGKWVSCLTKMPPPQRALGACI